ncbi:MAG TPA: YbaK/EbsC family protein [Candidatus Dojkabacteria bacterium]|nr:YbaK/EbsC family protein [Candidatus Dojkabacteria bacterium]
MNRIPVIEVVNKVGEEVLLYGWVATVRDHGQIAFLMIKDRTASLQCVVDGGLKESVGEGYVLEVRGVVKQRPENMRNNRIETGMVELEVKEYKVLSKSKELPLPLNDDGKKISEEVRLKYRYLDLRRDRMQKILKLRSDFVHELRKGLVNMQFTEVETPLLSKATKEGARDFIVPSRYNPGKFYALPQSPQQYKQLLMLAGVERYFQFARCVRDEDLRADRGYEFTQMDIEMSFVKQEDVLNTIGKVLIDAVKAVGGNLKSDQIPVISYQEAIEKYGADKFDVRTEEEKANNVIAFTWVNKFPFFKQVDEKDQYETNDSKSKWVFTHNPFSSPIPEHLDMHMKMENIGDIIADQYDLVCNGFEIGSGGIRAHNPEVLRKTYEIMGYGETEIEESIGHMLDAFAYGAPPHGGLAFGIDRLVMILANETSLKEVIPFPMTSTGKTAVMDAPARVPKQVLKDLHLDITDKGEDVVQSIKDALDAAGVEYRYLEHEEVRTSEESAKVRGVDLSTGAKAMVVKSKEYSNRFVMIVLPADKQLDLSKVKVNLNEDFEIAPAKEVEEYTGLKLGSIPPFGRMLKMDLYFDRSMFAKEVVAFNCGLRTASIIMKGEDLSKVTQPNKKSLEMEFAA